MKNLNLQDLVLVPKGWEDLKQFEEFIGEDPWIPSYLKYHEEIFKPWINKIYNKFGGLKELSDFENPKSSHYSRIEDGGIINLTCGFFLSVIKKNELGFIPISVPISRIEATINLLPYLIESQNEGRDIPLSDIVETNNRAKITRYGVSLPPGEQLMIYTVEKILMPEGYRGQITTKSRIGRRGLDTVSTAGNLNKGWKGIPVLELKSSRDTILLEPGVPIAQFYLIDASYSEGVYEGGFQDQKPSAK